MPMRAMMNKQPLFQIFPISKSFDCFAEGKNIDDFIQKKPPHGRLF